MAESCSHPSMSACPCCPACPPRCRRSSHASCAASAPAPSTCSSAPRVGGPGLGPARRAGPGPAPWARSPPACRHAHPHLRRRPAPLLPPTPPVAEEGIDVRSCQLVVRFDPPDTAQVPLPPRLRLTDEGGAWDAQQATHLRQRASSDHWFAVSHPSCPHCPPTRAPPHNSRTSSRGAGPACAALSCCSWCSRGGPRRCRWAGRLGEGRAGCWAAVQVDSSSGQPTSASPCGMPLLGEPSQRSAPPSIQSPPSLHPDGAPPGVLRGGAAPRGAAQHRAPAGGLEWAG